MLIIIIQYFLNIYLNKYFLYIILTYVIIN